MTPLDLNPTDRVLRQFAGVSLVVLGGGATWLALGSGAPLVLPVLGWTLAAVFGLGGLVRPPVARPLFVALTVLTWPIGLVVSFLLLAIIYYGVVTPVGLLLRLMGKDPLDRQPSPDATSYWIPRKTTTDPARYFRQF